MVWAGVVRETTSAVGRLGGKFHCDWTNTESAMLASTERLDGTPLVVVTGEIDHGSSSALQSEIEPCLDGGETTILLDLKDVTYMDSGGISVLLYTVRRLRRGNGWLGVVSPNTNVRRLLKIVGLEVDSGFRVFDDKESAATAIREMSTP